MTDEASPGDRSAAEEPSVDAAPDAPTEGAGDGAEGSASTEQAAADAAVLDAVEKELEAELARERRDDAIDPEVELDALRGELDVLQDRYLRTRAEFDNFRRRKAQELQNAWGRAQAELVESFLEALDDLQRVGTWDASSTDLAALIEGVDLVERKFKQALERAGVEALDPVGELFDPNFMEAMITVELGDDGQEDHVAQVFQKGYLLKGTLVRPARVGVYKSD